MIRVLYIAGAPRSGTTIADIIFGNLPGFFSCGELKNFSKRGLIENEYCSCGLRVKYCEFWGSVAKEWQSIRSLSLSEYNDAYNSLMKSKSFLLLFYRLYFPNRKFIKFKKDTYNLYHIIWKLNGHKVIIDSSKSPFRFFLLRKIGIKIDIIHVIRPVRGVIFSSLKNLKKDVQAGIEYDILPKRPLLVAINWLYVNFLIKIFSIGLSRKKLHFGSLCNNTLQNIRDILNDPFFYDDIYFNCGPFKPGHIVAGGRIRMKQDIFINREQYIHDNWKGHKSFDFFISWIERLNY